MAIETPELFEIRNSFLLGAYQNCINTAQNLRERSEEDRLKKDVLMYRAYIAQGKPNLVLTEINARTAQPPLKAVRLFADYMANPSKRSAIVKKLETDLMEDAAGDETVLLMAAHIYIHEMNLEEALRLLHQCESLESKALAVQCLLKIHRVDLAVKEVKKMHEIDEDAPESQLAQAWVNLATGKDKLKDVFYAYQEMIDKYGATPLLLVAQSSSLIQQQRFDEAEKLLLDALQRDANYPEAVINLIVVSQHLGKPQEVTTRYINQMKEGFPNHQWTIDYLKKEEAFDRLVKETVTVA